MEQFGCHTHFKILLEDSHPNHCIFSSNLDEIDLGDKLGVDKFFLYPHSLALPLPSNMYEIVGKLVILLEI